MIHIASEQHAAGCAEPDGSAEQAARLLCSHLGQRARSLGLPERAGLAAWQIGKVRSAIAASPREIIPLTSLAKMARLSPRHFCTAFRQSFGVPPHRWQMLARLEEARRRMEDPAASLTSIAHDCGFKSSSHFARVFRTVHGACPSRYRRGL